MPRIVVEHVEEEMTIPDMGMDLDQKLFVQIDPSRCTGCCKCMNYCPTSAIYGETGLAHRILHPDACLHCGVCLTHCPEGAIYEKFSWLPQVEMNLRNSESICIAMPAPSVRYALGEAFGMAMGRNVVDRMYSALGRLGFAHCWDTEFAADVTIWEEGSEFLQRLESGGPFPMFSSCCPGWQRYIELFQPDLIGNCSTVKSPIAINGRLAKTYGADSYGYKKRNMYTVAIMPCIAKKYEAMRPELEYNDIRDIDAVLTVRELIWLMRKRNVDLDNISLGMADNLMGDSACGTLFGIGGGVMETLSRFVHEKLTGNKFTGFAWRKVNKASGITEGALHCGKHKLLMASVRDGTKFEAVCNAVRRGESPYHFIEFMACPGGCINGAGLPLLPSLRKNMLLAESFAESHA